jgi:hypothetical protein
MTERDRAELVLHDRALVDASVLVEWRVGKQSALAADLDSPVVPLEDADALAREGAEPRDLARRDRSLA